MDCALPCSQRLTRTPIEVAELGGSKSVLLGAASTVQPSMHFHMVLQLTSESTGGSFVMSKLTTALLA